MPHVPVPAAPVSATLLPVGTVVCSCVVEFAEVNPDWHVQAVTYRLRATTGELLKASAFRLPRLEWVVWVVGSSARSWSRTTLEQALDAQVRALNCGSVTNGI